MGASYSLESTVYIICVEMCHWTFSKIKQTAKFQCSISRLKIAENCFMHLFPHLCSVYSVKHFYLLQQHEMS
jgi:hypothetical protein